MLADFGRTSTDVAIPSAWARSTGAKSGHRPADIVRASCGLGSVNVAPRTTLHANSLDAFPRTRVSPPGDATCLPVRFPIRQPGQVARPTPPCGGDRQVPQWHSCRLPGVAPTGVPFVPRIAGNAPLSSATSHPGSCSSDCLEFLLGSNVRVERTKRGTGMLTKAELAPCFSTIPEPSTMGLCGGSVPMRSAWLAGTLRRALSPAGYGLRVC